MNAVKLTAHELPKKVEAWPVCECCGEPGMPEGDPVGTFDAGDSWPVTHTYEDTVTVFETPAVVESYVDRAIDLIAANPQECAELRKELKSVFVQLAVERSKDLCQLLHTVNEFEYMLGLLFGERPEIHDDAVVWAFAYMMHLICSEDKRETNSYIHDRWESVMFDSVERACGIRDAAIKEMKN